MAYIAAGHVGRLNTVQQLTCNVAKIRDGSATGGDVSFICEGFRNSNNNRRELKSCQLLRHSVRDVGLSCFQHNKLLSCFRWGQ